LKKSASPGVCLKKFLPGAMPVKAFVQELITAKVQIVGFCRN